MKHRNEGFSNRHLLPEKVLSFARQIPEVDLLLRDYCGKLDLSHRSLINSIRAALSIMDFQEKSRLSPELLEEAFNYRKMKIYQDHIKSKAA